VHALSGPTDRRSAGVRRAERRSRTRYAFGPTPMTRPAPTYDLVLLLDLQSEESARAKIVADARAAIEAQGELLRHDEWGERPLAYPIERKTSAEYHLLQFHAGETELLDALDRSLRIADDVLRFRLIKLAAGVPDAPDMRSAAPAARRAEGEQRADGAGAGELAVAETA
jgi:small subunit ribosomal protein S6